MLCSLFILIFLLIFISIYPLHCFFQKNRMKIVGIIPKKLQKLQKPVFFGESFIYDINASPLIFG